MGNIEWLEIEHIPASLKDGRPVLLWDGEKAVIGYWDSYLDGEDWATDLETRPTVLMFAELNLPKPDRR